MFGHYAHVFSALIGSLYLGSVHAIPLDINDTASIRSAASTVAYGLMSYYTGNISSNPTGPGILPGPYYWWESGGMWGGMVDYWHYTNDPTYNDVVAQALVSQISSTNDFMPPAEQGQEGNDDQLFWGFAAMSAAEHNFSAPSLPPSRSLALAAAVFDDQVRRWDTSSCAGGLKWQIFPSNVGYDYKNSAANGGFFQLAARLARYTGNTTYISWAEKSWDWMSTVSLIGEGYEVYDGTQDSLTASGGNCTQVNEVRFSYTQAMVLYGASVLANATASTNGSASALWTSRASGLLEATEAFVSPFANASLVMYERACEIQGTCDVDQFSFKAYLSRWLAASAQLVPDLTDAIMKVLRTNALAAAAACSGGENGEACGQRWYTAGFDGSTGVGQQLSALEVIQGLLVTQESPPEVADGVDIRVVAATSTAPVPTATPMEVGGMGKPARTSMGANGLDVDGRWFALIFLVNGLALVC
ncbi:hydrolase 76 protein [Ptychographa xylographoides]|nr:hydrolase 76 protein [Ptychographa xylographoides]